MNSSSPTNFETFYFLELLDKILEKGRKEYDQESLHYLEKLVNFLRTDKDAQESIEKLAGSQNTSDLAIFLSDMLEQLYNISPNSALKKLPERAREFLEVVQVFLQNEDWKSAIAGEIELPETADEEALSLVDFCFQAIRGKIHQAAETVEAAQQAKFTEYMNAFINQPTLTRHLADNISEPAVNDFLELHKSILPTTTTPNDINQYMKLFENNLQEWIELFRVLFQEYHSEMSSILEAAEEAPREKPFEELFEEAAADKEEEFEAETAATSSVDEFVEKAAELKEQSQIKPTSLSEEEKERRKFLKDYVVGEVESFTGEILHHAGQFIKKTDRKTIAEKLKGALKNLKDLGQIHAYTGIELVAESLLQTFKNLQRHDKSFTQNDKSTLKSLLALLPAYIDAAIQENEQPVMYQITTAVAELQNNLQISTEENIVSLREGEAIEEPFQNVVTEYAQRIQQELAAEAPDFEMLETAFDTLIFWSNQLGLNAARETVETLRRLFVPAEFSRLDQQQKQIIIDLLSIWETAYVSTPAEIYREYNRQLQEFMKEAEAAETTTDLLNIFQARDAYADVATRRVSAMLEQMNAAVVDLEDILNRRLPAFLSQLAEGALLIKNEVLSTLCNASLQRLEEADTTLLAHQQGLADQLGAYFEKLRTAIPEISETRTAEEYIEEFSRILKPTAEVLEESAPDQTLPDTAAETEEAAGPESSPELEAQQSLTAEKDVPDSEIFDIFRIEALTYLEEISEYIQTLRHQPDDKDTLHQLGLTTHTLKGSAQMIGQDDIAELAVPLNRVIEMVENDSLTSSEELFNLFEAIVEAMKRRLNATPTEIDNLLRKLNQYIASEPLEEEAGTDEVSLKTKPEVPPVSGFIQLQEQDPELLSMFHDEVSNNFDLVEKHLTNLSKFSYDKEAIQQIETAVHEIHGAAKMLGIHEIASLTDQLERIFELLTQQKLNDLQAIIPVTRRAMFVIRELTTNHMVRDDIYQEVLENLTNAIEMGEKQPEVPEEALSSEAEEKETLVSSADVEELKPASQVLELYIQEGKEQLDDINYLLLKLEKDPANEELQHHLMRSMHTLKGSSGMVYAFHIETLSHRCEDLLDDLVKNKRELPTELFDILFSVVDEIGSIMDALQKSGKEELHNYNSIFEKLEQYQLDVKPGETAMETAPAITEQAAASGEEMFGPLTTIQEEPPKSKKKDTYLRLNINKMNHLLNLAAELVVSNNQFKTQLDRLKNFTPILNTNLKVFRDTEDFLETILSEQRRIQEGISPFTEEKPGIHESLKNQVENLHKALKNIKSLQDEATSITHSIKENSQTYDENLQKLNKLSNDLLDEIMQARLVPIDMLFQRFHRPIRDLARQLKKQIRLSIKGENTELDRTLVDELHEPLLHIIRNAIDHGLETVEERKSARKNPEGSLEMKASQNRNQVIIEISDDGRGIDLEEVKESAIAKGVLSEKDSRRLSEQEIYDFLFFPGFSTAKTTTKISGRGVGLDAVKAQIEKAKGDIRIYSEKGKGTTFIIRVPISLTVIQSMLVDVSGHVYSIPLLQVEETFNVSVEDIFSEKGKNFIRYREKKIPVIQLIHLLRIRDEKEKTLTTGNYPVIMVQDEGNRVALLVDKIIRREEILIKSLGAGLRRLKYISGGSIMADGQVVLVLDIPQIVQEIQKGPDIKAQPTVTERPPIMEEGKPHLLKRVKPPKKHIEGRKPVALIVDDSLSIRKYLSSLLMQKGYLTDTARNGYEALELLNKHEFDIMVTDLEMPKLSGYELIETLRYDQRFSYFPIIVLTGRAGDNFRQLTAELGADAYIVKPFKDRELFEQLDKFIDYKI